MGDADSMKGLERCISSAIAMRKFSQDRDHLHLSRRNFAPHKNAAAQII
jgi:hypothetical protein